MLCSFIARSKPLLSRLQRRAAAPGGAILPSRAYASSSPPVARCKGSDDAAAQRHLYLVLEENAMSRFSIYKLPHMHDAAADDGEAPRRLPPAAVHIGFTLASKGPHFEAVGSKIVATAEADTISEKHNCTQFITLLYDTKTGTLDCGRALPDPEEETWIKNGYHAAAAVGDKLCVLEVQGSNSNKPLYLYEEPVEVNRYLDEWVWEQSRSPLPRGATGEDNPVVSHTVHPDGRTIFASSSFTFSLDTETGKSVRRGDWRLPFHGRGYYDGDLDAWVGIRVANGTEDGCIKGYPYLCVCDVPTALANSRSRRGRKLLEPAWKMCKEELTFVEAPARARSPTLIHTGGGRFCLVEISLGGEARVTMFFPKAGHSASLVIASPRQLLPSLSPHSHPTVPVHGL